MPAVQKGVEQVLTAGAVAGFPLQDVRVIVYDGKHHPVDSKEVAFVAAGRRRSSTPSPRRSRSCWSRSSTSRSSARQATPATSPATCRRAAGQVTGTKRLQPGVLAVTGLAPLAELDGYSARLKSVTGGHGSWSMALSHYEQAPPTLQAQLATDFARHRRHEDE